MQRALRSKKLRSLLYYSQNGKCAVCGDELPSDWHADHIEPWVKTHRTNVHEMQALCPQCNLTKGDKMFTFDWSKCRRGTKEVLTTAIAKFASGKNIISVNMPTRYGKTPTGRLLTAISTKGCVTPEGIIVQPFASVNVWVTINLMLREQAASKDKWQEDMSRFNFSEPLRFGEIKDSYDNDRHLRPNGEHYLAVNIHKIEESKLVFTQWVKSLIRSTGLPPIFHFDEVHFYGENKPWGKLVSMLLDSGAKVIVWTATPKRSDGGIIPGFKSNEIGTSEYTQSVIVDEVELDGNEYWLTEKRRTRVTDYILESDIDIPFTEAWELGYLCKISRRTIDIQMSEIDGVNEDELRNLQLSNLTANTIRKHGLIGKLVRHPRVMLKAVQVAYESMKEYRRLNPKTAIVGFTVSDQDGGKNEHASLIKKMFLDLDQTLKIDIATQKTENAHDLIRDFVNNDHDIILFKGMGGVGWDCARVKVCLDLGDDRQDASKIQTWMRVGTPFDSVKVGTLITPSDALSERIWNDCVSNQGGAASVSVSELIDTELKKKQERVKTVFVVNGVEHGDFGDSNGIMASRDDEHMARLLYKAFPDFLRAMPDATVVHRARAVGLGVSLTEPEQKSVDEQIKEYQDTIIPLMENAIRCFYNKMYKTYEQSQWSNLSRQLYRTLHQRASIPMQGKYVEIRKNRDLAQLTRLYRQAELLEQEAQEYEPVVTG